MLLYTYPENFRAFKALIAAQFSGANVKVAPNFEFGVTNKSEAFLKKFPLGKVRNHFRIRCLAFISGFKSPTKINKSRLRLAVAICSSAVVMTLRVIFGTSRRQRKVFNLKAKH